MTLEIEARLRAASPAARTAAVLDAYAQNATVREIADVIGMSVGGVHRIIKKGATP